MRAMQSRKLVALLPAAAVAVALAAPAAGQEQPAATVETTDLLTFQPETVTVTVGDVVEWRNTSNLRHTVTADPAEAAYRGDVHLPEGAEPFNSGFIEPGDTWQHTFEVPGTYRYFCIPHEATGMIAEVVVEEAQP